MVKVVRTFDNPIIPGSYPDPSVCRVGDDYYLVTSSFEYFPALPVFHSRDLIHWRQIGHVLERSNQLSLAGITSSKGVFAPSIRYNLGCFYVVATNAGGDGNFVVTATKPEGPWSIPKYVDHEGYSPSLYFDEDGTAYYTRDGRGEDDEHPVIYAGRIDLHQGKVVNKLRPIFAGTGGAWSEGAHLYRWGAYYYLVTAEGGTTYEHSVVVARSKKPLGPYETCPHNPVICHRNLERHPFQTMGHADLFETQNGDTYAVLLGSRPKGGRFQHLGRETYLVPVTWNKDGWPVFGKQGQVEVTLPTPNLPEAPWPSANVRENFDGSRLPFEFVFVRNPLSKSYSLKARQGFLRLQGLASTLSEIEPVAFVGRRQQHFNCTYAALLDFQPEAMGDEAGLVVRRSEAYHYALVVRRRSLTKDSEREIQLWSVVAGRKQLVEKASLPTGLVTLEITATAKEYAFSFVVGKKRRAVGVLPTRPLSTEYGQAKSGILSLTGVVVGLYASGQGQQAQSPADFDWFEYRPESL
jgi:alpha-N-arabinofuranosidase